MPDEHDVPQVVELQYLDDVLHVRGEADRWGGEVGPVAHPRQRRRVHFVTLLEQERGDTPPAPAAVDEHERSMPARDHREPGQPVHQQRGGAGGVSIGLGEMQVREPGEQ